MLGTAILALGFAALAAGCSPAPVEHTFSGRTMGTTYTVKVVSPPL